MSVNTVEYRGNLGAANTDRNPSPNVWFDCPWMGIREGNISGLLFDDDFTSFQKTPATTEGNWAAEHGYAQFSDTGGTITAGTGQGGEVAIGSDGDNEGCSFRTLATPFKLARALGQFWFECRIKSSTITDTKHNIFIGLMQDVALTATVPITAAGALADTNLVGFRRGEGAAGGALIDTVYKCDGVTAVTVQAGMATLVADTYVKLGIRFEPLDPDSEVVSSGVPVKTNNLSFYVNGIRATTSKNIPSAAGTDFPNDIGLGLVFAVLNATGTTPGTSTIDWWRAAQLI